MFILKSAVVLRHADQQYYKVVAINKIPEKLKDIIYKTLTRELSIYDKNKPCTCLNIILNPVDKMFLVASEFSSIISYLLEKGFIFNHDLFKTLKINEPDIIACISEVNNN